MSASPCTLFRDVSAMEPRLVLLRCPLDIGILASAANSDTVVISDTGFGGALETFPETFEFTSWTQSGSLAM
jgi:hypothetical protein